MKENKTMKNLTPELIRKAKAAKSAEELLELAKANDVELAEEEARIYFEQLNAVGKVSDDELDSVAGGDGLSCSSGDEEDEGSSSSGTYKVHCPCCQGLVSRLVSKCPWCGKVFN
jgi:hypothetical protein